MILGILCIVIALFIGFGAVQEFIVRGIQAGELQPLLVGLAGITVSILVAASGVALWRQSPGSRRLMILSGALSVLFHVYAALSPHRIVGLPALIVGAGIGLLLLGVAMRPGRPEARPA